MVDEDGDLAVAGAQMCEVWVCVRVFVTGGAFAAGRLPEMYYAQFIRAAREGGMAAVCNTEQYRERLAANPGNRDYLMSLDPQGMLRCAEILSRLNV